MNLNEAKRILKQNGYILNEDIEIYDLWREDEDLDNYIKAVKEYLANNYPDKKVDVSSLTDTDIHDNINHSCHINFIFDHIPTSDDVNECDNIRMEIADYVPDCNCPWNDENTLIFAVTNGIPKNITDIYNKNPERLAADYYKVCERFYCTKQIPEPD